MVLIGSRSTPAGSSSERVKIRCRICATSSPISSAGSCARSHTMSSLRLCGCGASGHTSAVQPRSLVYMPDTCSSGRPCACARPICSRTASLCRRRRQKSHSRGWRAFSSRAMRQGGAHVRQRFVSRLVHQAVGPCQVRQPERRAAIVVQRPLDAIGAQRPGTAQHVEQVPAAALMLPLACIRIDQAAPEQEPRDLVVEADRVVADADGRRPCQLVFDARCKLMLAQAACQRVLRHDAGEQAGLGLGQHVVAAAGTTRRAAHRSRAARHRCARRRTAPGGVGAAHGRRFRSRARRS